MCFSFLFSFSPSFYKVDNPRFRWRSGQHFGKRTGSRGFEFHRSSVVCFFGRCWQEKRSLGTRVGFFGTSHWRFSNVMTVSVAGRFFSKQICSFFLSETSDRFTRHSWKVLVHDPLNTRLQLCGIRYHWISARPHLCSLLKLNLKHCSFCKPVWPSGKALGW